MQNESHVAISFGPEEEKVKCRAMLKKDYPSLKNETKEQFKKMFDDTQVVFDVNRGAIVMINRKIFWIYTFNLFKILLKSKYKSNQFSIILLLIFPPLLISKFDFANIRFGSNCDEFPARWSSRGERQCPVSCRGKTDAFLPVTWVAGHS